jgi:acetyl/propionyl-CoA carboxylase alpha subunit
MYLEKLIEEPRHIEIQVIEIQHGKVLSFRK